MGATKEMYAEQLSEELSPREIAVKVISRLKSILEDEGIILMEKSMDGMVIDGLYMSLPVRNLEEFESQTLLSLGL